MLLISGNLAIVLRLGPRYFPSNFCLCGLRVSFMHICSILWYFYTIMLHLKHPFECLAIECVILSSQATLIVDNVHLHILPSMNPDGFQSRQRGNANNIDLNRDFPDQVCYTAILSHSCSIYFKLRILWKGHLKIGWIGIEVLSWRKHEMWTLYANTDFTMYIFRLYLRISLFYGDIN